MRCVFCCFFSFSLSRFRCLSSSLWFPLALVWQPWHVLFCLLFELLWALCFYLHLSLALPFFLALFLLWFAVALLLYLLLSCTNCMYMTVRCETKRAYALIPLLHHSPIAFKLANHCQPLFWAWAPKLKCAYRSIGLDPVTSQQYSLVYWCGTTTAAFATIIVRLITTLFTSMLQIILEFPNKAFNLLFDWPQSECCSQIQQHHIIVGCISNVQIYFFYFGCLSFIYMAQWQMRKIRAFLRACSKKGCSPFWQRPVM